MPTARVCLHAMLLAACFLHGHLVSGLDKPVRGSVQGSPNDDDGGDGQDQDRDRRGACVLAVRKRKKLKPNRKKWFPFMCWSIYFARTSRGVLSVCPSFPACRMTEILALCNNRVRVLCCFVCGRGGRSDPEDTVVCDLKHRRELEGLR